MIKRTLRPIVIALLLSLAACDGSDETAQPPSSFVVEGWIDDGGFPVVILTQTLPISKDFQNVNDLTNYVIRWAKVSVSDGTDTVVLTGKYDDGFFPPYIYTTGRMRGEVGKTYTLTAEYKDLHATATTTIPSRPAVDSFIVEKCAGTDTLLQIKACLTDNPREKNYYQILTRMGTKSKQFIASYLGSVDDAVTHGHIEIPVYRPHQAGTSTYTPYFSCNDTVTVKVAQVSPDAFHFWDQYTKAQSLSTNLFLSTATDIPTNIAGGMGYWCGFGAVEQKFILSDYK